MCFFLSLQHEQTRWTLLFSSALSPSGPAQWRTIGSRWYRKTPFDPPVDRSSGFSGGCFQPWPGNPEGRVMKLVIFVTLDKWARVYIPLTVKFNTCGPRDQLLCNSHYSSGFSTLALLANITLGWRSLQSQAYSSWWSETKKTFSLRWHL